MKLSKQSVLKMDYSNAELRIVDDRLWIIEYDKDGNPIDEWDLMNELEKNEGFLEEIGFKISIARTYGK
jgi:hypothetical protein